MVYCPMLLSCRALNTEIDEALWVFHKIVKRPLKSERYRHFLQCTVQRCGVVVHRNRRSAASLEYDKFVSLLEYNKPQ